MTRGTSPFRFPVSDLLETGHRREVAFDASVDWTLELSQVGPSLHGDFTLEGASGGILARGRVDTAITSTCHRCLTEWTEPLEVAVVEVLGLGEDPDGYPLHGDVADLESPIRDTLLLELPLAPTCRPGCLGLCARCGGDLNTGSCPGHEKESDSPFASLRELFEP